jgi:hypothetical protein
LTRHAPIRGTQSFVGVMGEVWRRPALTGRELLWRAIAFAPATFLLLRMHLQLPTDPAPPSAEQALAMLTSIEAFFSSLANVRTISLLLGLGVFWIAVATAGRAVILRALMPSLRPRLATLFVLGLLRALLIVLMIAAWLASWALAFRHFLWEPLTIGGDPNLVGGFACIVFSALLLFMLWCVTGWILQAAPLYVMQDGAGVSKAMQAAFRNRALRSKLVEINLVMGIVKVCLVVLAMVFSASPLPFSTVETQGFLNLWWTGVGVLWVLASDYFHVVKSAACLRLYQALV